MLCRVLFAAVAICLTLAALATTTESRAARLEVVSQLYLPLLNCLDCGSTPEPTPTPEPSPRDSALQVIELVNAARIAEGCPAAEAHPILMRAAQDWSDEMARIGLQHSPPQHYQSYGYLSPYVENIASNSDPVNTVNDWLRSPPHRANMLFCSPDYSAYELGAGVRNGFWTLIVGTRY